MTRMKPLASHLRVAAFGWLIVIPLLASCGSDGPTSPTSAPTLPLVRETASMRYYHEPGDAIDVEWQEGYNAWALARLGLQPAQKVEYRKYVSRAAMERHTGRGNTNGFAESELWRLHTVWPTDNREVIHIYTALIERPSDFFNEGIAVSFQTDPQRGVLGARFNGVDVHKACRDYLLTGRLPRPVSRYATTTDFRSLPDGTLSYRYAGSFVRFLTERFGLPAVLQFFRTSAREDPIATIRIRVEVSFGLSLDEIEDEWLDFLRRF